MLSFPAPLAPKRQGLVTLDLISWFKGLQSPQLDDLFNEIVGKGRVSHSWCGEEGIWRYFMPLFYEWLHKVQQKLPSGCTRAHSHFFLEVQVLNFFPLQNEIIKANVSKLSALRGAETFMSTILLFEVWCREPGLLCGTLFRLGK